MKVCPVVAKLLCGRTDVMKLIVAFLNFGNVPTDYA